MSRVKFCGLSRVEDIEAANELLPDYVGFVFWKNSKRYVSPEKSKVLRKSLSQKIQSVGVFVDEDPKAISEIDAIGIIQLHGHEDDEYISRLRKLTDKPIIKAFKIRGVEDVKKAEESSADFVMLDSGMGTGNLFDWSLIGGINRPYFLAGGLDPLNIGEALSKLKPYAVDVSSGIETEGVKDRMKMSEFLSAVRKEKQ